MYNIVQSTKKLYLHLQDDKTTVPDYARDFKSLWETCESFGGTPGYHEGLVNQMLKDTSRVADVNRPSTGERKAAVNDTAEAVKGAMLLSGADQKRFGSLKKELHNDYLKGTDNYPYTLDRAVRLLENYEGPKQLWRPPVNPSGELAFVQQGASGRGRGKKAGTTTTAGTSKTKGDNDAADAGDGGGGGGKAGGARTNRHGDSHCYHCGREGHYAAECPDLSEEQQQQLHMSLGEDAEDEGGEEGTQLLHVCMVQREGLPDNRVYLDNCSTVTGFKDAGRIEGISEVTDGMKVNCNAGEVMYNKVGSWGKLKAWHLPGSIANIISMNELESHYRVTYDSWDGRYTVHTEHGPVYFTKDEHGLPYIELGEGQESAGVLFLQTVRGNYEGFTKKEVLRAREARRLQGLVGSPSEKDFKGMVSGNLIKNCPIDGVDISNARTIFGPDLKGVRGKTVRRKPQPVTEEDYVAIPRETVLRNRVITLSADVFFVDGIPFLLTLSRGVKFVTAEFCPCRTAKQLVKQLKRVLQVYSRAGFTVRYVLMDGEFEKLKDELPSIVTNTTAAKEHVTDAERMIRTVKERARGTICTLPFTHIPRRMKIELVYMMILWLNAFPVRNGISSVYSPRELVVHTKMDYKKHCRVGFGEY